MAFLTPDKLNSIGFRQIGKDVKISEHAIFYNPGNIVIGDKTRIDDFCILSAGEGGISLGRNVHIATGVAMIGAGEMSVGDFAGISGGSRIFSSTDDYVSGVLTNPTVPLEYKHVITSDIIIGRHALIGAMSVVVPRPPVVVIGEGASFGAFSLINKDYKEWMVYFGQPAKFYKERDKEGILAKEKEYLEKEHLQSRHERE